MWNEQKLDKLLCEPSKRLVSDMKKIKGDIIFLGAGGKMGPSICVLAQNAIKKAGTDSKVIAVSRFSDRHAVNLLKENGIEMISADLLEPGALEKLPDAPNIIYMAGRKFGTNSQEYLTWAMNVWLPSRVAERYKNSRIVVFSSGNVYPQSALSSGGATESTPVNPVGEYAMSCVGRERMFEYAAQTFGTALAIYRLNYAVDLRYGVLFDIASKIQAGEPVSLSMPAFNCIWQGDANEVALRSLLHVSPDIFYINVSGPETASVYATAKKLGEFLNKPVLFCDEPSDTALISNTGKMAKLFGYPSVALNKMIEWQVEWLISGGRSLGKPTHFEEKKGDY